MDDIIETIQSILPQISKTQLQLIETRLTEIGVETVDNLKYITSSDLSDIVKIVPARKLITCIQKKFEDTSANADDSGESTYHTDNSTSTYLYNSAASTSSSSFSDEGSSVVWAQSYVIPWEKFPKLFLDECQAGKRPTEYLRREAIRILVDSIREEKKKLASRDMHIIAAKFVDKFKDALGDKVLGKVIGSGYSSILSNIVERFNNLNRKGTPISDGEGQASSHVSHKSYGCLSTWSMALDAEFENELTKKKDWMKSEYSTSKNMTCESTIKEYMQDTYPLQRKMINSSPTADVIKEFPFLFEKEIVGQHFLTLTGHSLNNYTNAEKRKFSIIHCLRKENSGRLRKELEEMDRRVQEVNPHIKLIAFIKLLMAYFKEDSLLEVYEPCTDVKTVESVKRQNGAPIIAVIGDFYSPLMLHVVLENKVVKTIHNIDDAVMILFGVYYIFNLEYHPKASQTLEFIQRALIGINPDNGSKKPKKLTKKGCVSSKVVMLASHIHDF